MYKWGAQAYTSLKSPSLSDYPLNILTRPQDSGWVGSFRAKCHPRERWDNWGLTHEAFWSPGSPRWTKPSFPLGTWSSWTEHTLEGTLSVGFWLQLQEGALSVESPRQCKGGSFFLRKMCSLSDVFHTHNFLSWVSILLDRDPPTVLRRNLPWRINHESGVCVDEGRASRWDSYPLLVEGWRKSGGRRRQADERTDICSPSFTQGSRCTGSAGRDTQGVWGSSLFGALVGNGHARQAQPEKGL